VSRRDAEPRPKTDRWSMIVIGVPVALSHGLQ
jgi:hypothetical protein